MADLLAVLMSAGLEPLDAQAIVTAHETGKTFLSDLVQDARRGWWTHAAIPTAYQRLLDAKGEGERVAPVKMWTASLDALADADLLTTPLGRLSLARHVDAALPATWDAPLPVLDSTANVLKTYTILQDADEPPPEALALFAAYLGKMLDAAFVKGGEGSGNFSHAGRPGEVGGSAPDATPPYVIEPDRAILGEAAPNGYPVPGPDRTKLAQVEEYLKSRMNESAFVLDAKGNLVLLLQQGNKDSVHFTPEQMSLFANNILTHNHNDNSSFSAEDITIGLEKGLSEIRAVGRKSTYVMRFPPSVPKADIEAEALRKAWPTIRDAALEKGMSHITSGEWDVYQANREVGHMMVQDWMKQTGTAMGITYERQSSTAPPPPAHGFLHNMAAALGFTDKALPIQGNYVTKGDDPLTRRGDKGGLEVGFFDALPDLAFLKGGEGSGNFDHEGRPGLVGGSETNGKPTPSRGERKTLGQAEALLRRYEYEDGYLFAPDGERIIFSVSGSEDGIDFTDEQAAQFKDNILTHNHPGGRSFSLLDVSTSISYGLAEVRAVGADYTYSMRFPPALRGDTVESTMLLARFPAIAKAVLDEGQVKLDSGEWTIKQANAEVDHLKWMRWMSKHGDALGVTYERTPYANS